MRDFFQRTDAQFVLWAAIGAALVAIGVYVVMKVRTWSREGIAGTHDLLTNFRELHDQGELSDEEYRKVKTTLAARLQQELKGKGDEG